MNVILQKNPALVLLRGELEACASDKVKEMIGMWLGTGAVRMCIVLMYLCRFFTACCK